MNKKKELKYHLRNTCEDCDQVWWQINLITSDPTFFGIVREPRYNERINGCVAEKTDRIIEQDHSHSEPRECIRALKIYIDNVKSELENNIPSECSCCRRY